MNIRRRPPNPSIKVANLEYAIPHSDGKPVNILEKIVWEKDREIEIARKKVPLEKLKSQVSDLPRTKDFIAALEQAVKKPAVIAEIKKASPSKGVIREDFDPIEISKAYKKGGASCLSVLTDKTFFQGGFEVLVDVRKNVDLPLLCKDFILSPYQLYQARVAGADAVLFIASILSNQDLIYLGKIATSLGLSILVEVHNANEFERVLDLNTFKLIGINNRDLKSFKTDLLITESLAREFNYPVNNQNIVLVSESGLSTKMDLEKVYGYGAKAVLIGESLMRKENIEKGLRELIED
tara:strand:+ start:4246 stop:5130 length:885 start_codon:yes stop_codon:yes gene_type:complete